MRLLNAHTLKLQEFLDDIPSYAILSHTWEEEEVLLADFQDMTRAKKKKKGFDKINKTCEQAICDGFDWCWIDTCCIDKTSSAELSEAINSMFTWYKQSAKCYAYLADVGKGEDQEQEEPEEHQLGMPSIRITRPHSGGNVVILNKLNEEVRNSKWFTRAWTLQELLAPSSVRRGAEPGQEFVGMEFFSAKWESLGSKLELKDIISSTTGIAEDYLTGSSSLGSASIGMRMSWAAARQATRPEDIAYSLLGIFDVNMPLLYGEGKVKAFRRLQEEIMKVSEDETLFAWESSELTANPTSGDALASDPRDFSEARDLVPFVSDDPVIPYTLTNRGLRIWLQIHEYSKDIRPIRSPVMIRSPFTLYAAVLRCHVSHNFDSVVVIPVRRMTANLYLRDTTTSVGLLPLRLLSQFPPLSEVYIRNSLITSMSHSMRRRFGFLIRSLPHGLRIARAFPRESWDRKDRILQGEPSEQGRRWWNASLELAMDETPPLPSKHSAFLSLGCRQEINDSEVKHWCHLDDAVWPDSERDLDDFNTNAFQRPARSEVSRFRDRRGASYHALLQVKIKREKLFGQQMFIVDVEFASKENLTVTSQRMQDEDGRRRVKFSMKDTLAVTE
ncbi:hypothetical protein yc1106_07742 [Curvularia clavata]|uniref:Heterokaryon incompatibility domain-containing protein n=1 Tax=Curvularia clavata TaxID=95742 RepID=A0A9Q9DU18_CURCL|nr:hypothetical protein yc1106_07742 [Curvularia clavata]